MAKRRIGRTLLVAIFFIIVIFVVPPDFFSVAASTEPEYPAIAYTQELKPDSAIGGLPSFESFPPDSDMNGIEEISSEEEGLGGVQEPEEYSRIPLLMYTTYVVQKDDVPGGIANKYGLWVSTVMSVNTSGIPNARSMPIGAVLRIPNQDGVLYTVKQGDTLASIAERQGSTVESILVVNELFSDTVSIKPGMELFIPGIKMDQFALLERSGDLFQWPITSRRITSGYGLRYDPFGSGSRYLHTGLDIGAPYETPVHPAMAGRVSYVGYNNIYGNHVIITHHSEYKTLYAHLIRKAPVKVGDSVDVKSIIGNVGSTGNSTGPHLHLTVYKNGKTIDPRGILP
ncbi:peptidoglycan-binding protein LysM [Spirochaetia bacterium]|nr:peptidoglycan-binding protein LysM [Spirochaetia bacterium]GHU32750.1 peptidoglycan-binding protein LysM [Spirochaetia bacterium]